MIRFAKDNATWLGAGMLLTFSSSYGQTFFISLFAGEIRSEFGLSQGEWSAIYTIGTLTAALTMIWFGTTTDRFRVRQLGPIVLVGLALGCVAMATTPWAWSLPVVIFVLRFCGQGMLSHIAMVAMSRWFRANRGKALSFATTGFSIAEAFLPLIVVATFAFLPWRSLWIFAAALALAAIFLLGLLLRKERTPQALAKENPSPGMLGRHWTRSQTLRHWLFWMMIPALLGPPAFNTAFFFHQVHFVEIKGWSHLQLVALFPFYTGTAVAAMWAFGAALDKFGTGRLLPWHQLPMVLAFSIFSVAVHTGHAAIGLFCLALTTGATATLPNAFWAEYYGTKHLGAVKSVATAVMVFASAMGPGITGLLIDGGIGLEQQYRYVAIYFFVASGFTTLGLFWARPLRAAAT